MLMLFSANLMAQDVKTVTVAEFNAAAVDDNVWYQLTGTVKNLKDGDQYGNFDLEDATGSVYVYGLLSEKGGAKKKFQELVTAQGIQNGSLLTLIGTRGVYGSKIEVMNAYFVSVDNSNVDNQPVETVKVNNIAAFNKLTDGTLAELTLTDAQVLYVNDYNGTREIFVRDATGAVDLYNLGIEASAGQMLNGTIIGKRGVRGGFVYAMLRATSTDASTVTVAPDQPITAVEIGFDEAADYFCNYVVLKDVTVDNKKAVNADKETLALYDRFQLKLIDDLKGDGTKYDIYGLMYDGGSQYGAELVVTAVTLAGGGEVVEEPATTVTSIGELLKMGNTQNIELTLTEAKVLFNDNNYIYLRQEGKTLCFYQMPDELKKALVNNALVTGLFNGDYEVYRLLPEVKTNKHFDINKLTITESDEAAVPVETTIANIVAGQNVCDLVTLKATLVKDQTFNEDGSVKSTTYKLKDGDQTIVVVNNGKNLNKIEADTEVIVTGIVNTANDAYQVKLVKTAETAESQAISTVNATSKADAQVYNLQGQRVAAAQLKGLYIVGGKKMMVK
jgi:hypothetical protein